MVKADFGKIRERFGKLWALSMMTSERLAELERKILKAGGTDEKLNKKWEKAYKKCQTINEKLVEGGSEYRIAEEKNKKAIEDPYW